MAPKRTSKTNLEKREVIEWINVCGGGVPTRALRHFKGELGWKVSAAQIRYWWKNWDAILSSPALQCRIPGGGRHPRLGEIKDLIFDQILRMRGANQKVSRQWIQSTAIDLAKAENEGIDFQTSDKWLELFMARYGLSLRRTTNLTVLSDDELTARAVNFMAYLSMKKLTLNMATTLLMDETAVFFEDPRRDTIDLTGARHVVLRSTGFASMRITVSLTVTADGKKLPPLLIWKGTQKSRSTIENRGSVYVACLDEYAAVGAVD